MSDGSLRLTEIFHSLQGESSRAGLPTTFIRLTGCPLRCVYCDTTYAFEGGSKWTLREILQEVAGYAANYICVTGGEPLAQPNCIQLLDALIDEGYQVSLETSGAMPIGDVNPEVARIVDLKTPGSGELSRNLWGNIELLRQSDQIKFVIGDPVDFDWAISKVIEYDLISRVGDVFFSPVHGDYPLDEFARKIIDSGLSVRLQLQLHKYIWDDVRGR